MQTVRGGIPGYKRAKITSKDPSSSAVQSVPAVREVFQLGCVFDCSPAAPHTAEDTDLHTLRQSLQEQAWSEPSHAQSYRREALSVHLLREAFLRVRKLERTRKDSHRRETVPVLRLWQGFHFCRRAADTQAHPHGGKAIQVLGVRERIHQGEQSDAPHACSHWGTPLRVLWMRERLFTWQRTEKTHNEPCRSPALRLSAVCKNVHVPQSPEKTLKISQCSPVSDPLILLTIKWSFAIDEVFVQWHCTHCCWLHALHHRIWTFFSFRDSFLILHLKCHSQVQLLVLTYRCFVCCVVFVLFVFWYPKMWFWSHPRKRCPSAFISACIIIIIIFPSMR